MKNAIFSPLRRWLSSGPAGRYVRLRRNISAAKQWSDQDEAHFNFYRHLISPSSLCFDIGANIGNRTKVFLRLGAQVVAVEPQRECGRVLRLAFPSPRLQVETAAVSSMAGAAELYLSGTSVVSTLSRDWIRAVRESGRFCGMIWDKSETVTTITLDQLAQKHGVPDFVKLDIEGYESEALLGFSQIGKTTVQFEFIPERWKELESCVTRLSEIGAREFNFSLGEDMRMQTPAWLSPTALLDSMKSLIGDCRVFGDVFARGRTKPPCGRDSSPEEAPL